ncbi:hypothetical protein EV186_103801 [Labedaea rhizosphaerae]|uniref:YCII-related domain-containing protein n=2 Tax=Labedaea rhizosphaerae TaxID=598644 RepID=A0A4R6SDQ5_LABRH|nr:hypothetical protein EV186_103801 [Labedaea rhizosphaerae]
MKYMILTYGSQQDYDGMSGKTTDTEWTGDAFAKMAEFMNAFNKSLADSGELVETRACAAPVHTRRVGPGNVVTNGPYAETQEVLAGYWIVECDSFDRATEIALRLGECPAPEGITATAYADVRPIMDGADDIGL